ncbi:MAG: protein phosphatase 2C domain-containing protein [Defluviitaleaceae bacterium]|nr:protein phosphatase 2C domain-containing protein [Defluviitaleaceae bacterium]
MWRGFGTKVRGATHIRNGLPCQDAIRVEAYGETVVAAIADGHGSAACPYSDEGSQAAVDCMHELFADIFAGAGAETKDILENSRELRLPRQLAAAWRQRVEEIHNAAREGEPFSYTLYGTTALCVLAAPGYIFALQLGDGDILAVPKKAVPYRLVETEDMPGNETYSLCLPDCWRHVHTNMIYPKASDSKSKGGTVTYPSLIMLTTDGYGNSFMTDDGFMKAGVDIRKILHAEGAEYVEEHLAEWLDRSSAEGSGDDIAMGLVYSSP